MVPAKTSGHLSYILKRRSLGRYKFNDKVMQYKFTHVNIYFNLFLFIFIYIYFYLKNQIYEYKDAFEMMKIRQNRVRASLWKYICLLKVFDIKVKMSHIILQEL